MRNLPLAVSLLTTLVLAACGGGGGSSVPEPKPPVVTDFTIGGTVSGLPLGNTMVLTLNGAAPLTVSADGSFTFSTRLTESAAYQALVMTQPAGAVCEVNNGAGTVAKANVSNLLVSCLVPPPPPPPAPADYAIGGELSGLPTSEKVMVSLNGGQALELASNAKFSFAARAGTGAAFDVKVVQQPASAHCVVTRGVGAVQARDVGDIAVRCTSMASDPSAPLLDNSKLHRLRLTITADEWQAFVQNSERSRYDQDAHGNGGWSLWSISEVYRRGTLEYLDANGALIKSMSDVGFRMRGNTSRQWPEVWTQDPATGQWSGSPRRFHINLKFDEDFSGDESVYACIDANGPAAVNDHPCYRRVADDIAPVPGNKDRTFMGMESFALKFNKDDPSYLREPLAYAILNDRGVVAGRAVHASLELVVTPGARETTLFGRRLPQTFQMGVFSLVEPVDKLMVQRRFGKNGYLFKVGGGDLSTNDPDTCLSFDARGSTHVSGSFCRIGVEQPDPVSRLEWIGAAKVNDPAWVNSDINDSNGQRSQFKPYLPNYDLKTKKSSLAAGRVELKKFIALVSDPATTAAQLEAVFDVDGFIRAQAVEIAIGAVDHYVRVANNYYLYQHPDTKKWSYIPYDYDFVFRDSHIASWPENPPFRNVASSTVFSGAKNWRASRIDGVNPRLYDIVFASASNQAKLLAEIASLREQWFDWAGRTGPMLEQWLARIEPAIARTNVAEPDSGDTQYKRAAATGDSYTYSSWVNESNPLASQRGGPYPGNATAPSILSNDTIKRFISSRNAALAAEAK